MSATHLLLPTFLYERSHRRGSEEDSTLILWFLQFPPKSSSVLRRFSSVLPLNTTSPGDLQLPRIVARVSGTVKLQLLIRRRIASADSHPQPESLEWSTCHSTPVAPPRQSIGELFTGGFALTLTKNRVWWLPNHRLGGGTRQELRCQRGTGSVTPPDLVKWVGC